MRYFLPHLAPDPHTEMALWTLAHSQHWLKNQYVTE